MIRSHLLYVWLLAFIISCKEAIELDPMPRDFNESLTLIPTDTLIFQMGYRSNVYSKYVKKVEINGSEYLGVVNENTNELEFYALSNAVDDFKVHFKTEGPNGVGQIKGFELMADSTFLIGSSLRIRLYVTDLKGNLLKILKTDLVERKEYPAIQLYYTQQPLMFDKIRKNVFLYARGQSDYNLPGKLSGTMFLKIPNMNDESAIHMFELPSQFNKYVHGAYFSHSSHVLADDRYLIFGIPFYNNIFIYDLKKEELIEREAGSKYFGDALPWDSPNMDGHEEFYVTSNSYRELAYDEENKLLYRIAYQGVDYTGPDSQRRNWDNKLPSVVILNSDFEKVGELDLPKNTLYTRMYFTHNGKLYLSLNHPDNSPSEDKMVFVGFKPEKL